MLLHPAPLDEHQHSPTQASPTSRPCTHALRTRAISSRETVSRPATANTDHPIPRRRR